MAKRKSHPGSIEKRGKSWRLVLYAGGTRHAYTLKGKQKKADVERFARSKSEELLQQVERERVGLPGSLPLESLLQRYEGEKLPLLSPNTRLSYATSLKLFRKFLDRIPSALAVHEFRSGHGTEFLSWARVKPLSGRAPSSNRTLERHRAVLHAVFSFAEELELREGNPITRVSRPKVEIRDPVILDEVQYERLIAESAHNPFLELFVQVLGESGMRCESEALWLQWEDIDLEAGFIRVVSGRNQHRTKSGASRWVPMTPRLREAMREHFANFRLRTYKGVRTPWLFHHDIIRRNATAGQRLGSLRRAFANAAERAEISESFTQHDLRHRRITTWLATGHSAVLVKEAVGHADLRTTMGYTHLVKEHLKSLVDEGTITPPAMERGTG